MGRQQYAIQIHVWLAESGQKLDNLVVPNVTKK